MKQAKTPILIAAALTISYFALGYATISSVNDLLQEKCHEKMPREVVAAHIVTFPISYLSAKTIKTRC